MSSWAASHFTLMFISGSLSAGLSRIPSKCPHCPLCWEHQQPWLLREGPSRCPGEGLQELLALFALRLVQALVWGVRCKCWSVSVIYILHTGPECSLLQCEWQPS